MLLNIPNPLRLLRQEESGDEESSTRTSAGLGILAAAENNYPSRRLTRSSLSSPENACNIVMNSSEGLKSSKPNISSHTKQNSKNSNFPDYNCFLKSCYLCNKPLRLDKEVHMYRGDIGFCSIQCRSRQIYMDERREKEISIKEKLAWIRRCRDSSSNYWRDNSCQEDYRRRRSRPYKKNPVIFLE